MIALLQEKKIQKYDILIIQESWRFRKKAKIYNSSRVGFAIKNNDKRTCFYINKRINSNSWHTIWHFKDVSTITLQRSEREDDKVASASPINIHEMYNSLSRSHNEAHNKRNLSLIKRAMIMFEESVIVDDFNLHHLF